MTFCLKYIDFINYNSIMVTNFLLNCHGKIPFKYWRSKKATFIICKLTLSRCFTKTSLNTHFILMGGILQIILILGRGKKRKKKVIQAAFWMTYIVIPKLFILRLFLISFYKMACGNTMKQKHNSVRTTEKA